MLICNRTIERIQMCDNREFKQIPSTTIEPGEEIEIAYTAGMHLLFTIRKGTWADLFGPEQLLSKYERGKIYLDISSKGKVYIYDHTPGYDGGFAPDPPRGRIDWHKW